MQFSFWHTFPPPQLRRVFFPATNKGTGSLGRDFVSQISSSLSGGEGGQGLTQARHMLRCLFTARLAEAACPRMSWLHPEDAAPSSPATEGSCSSLRWVPHGIWDAGHSIRDAGCRMQDVECRVLTPSWCGEQRGEAAHPKTWLLLTHSVVDSCNKPKGIPCSQSWSWSSSTKYIRQKHVGTGGLLHGT